MYTHSHTHTHTQLLVLRPPICTSQTLIDPHYFNMKITTTWNFSHGSNIQRLVTALYGSPSLQFCFFSSPRSTVDQGLQGLPTITQLAQHLPSHHCGARKRCFASFFSLSSSSVYFGCSFLFRMEILRSIGVACSGRTVPSTKGRMRDGRRVEKRQQEVAGEISIFNRQWGSFKTAPMCSLFQLGFDRKWSEARAG